MRTKLSMDSVTFIGNDLRVARAIIGRLVKRKPVSIEPSEPTLDVLPPDAVLQASCIKIRAVCEIAAQHTPMGTFQFALTFTEALFRRASSDA